MALCTAETPCIITGDEVGACTSSLADVLDEPHVSSLSWLAMHPLGAKAVPVAQAAVTMAHRVLLTCLRTCLHVCPYMNVMKLCSYPAHSHPHVIGRFYYSSDYQDMPVFGLGYVCGISLVLGGG